MPPPYPPRREGPPGAAVAGRLLFGETLSDYAKWDDAVADKMGTSDLTKRGLGN